MGNLCLAVFLMCKRSMAGAGRYGTRTKKMKAILIALDSPGWTL
jgi:hypothetical protein